MDIPGFYASPSAPAPKSSGGFYVPDEHSTKVYYDTAALQNLPSYHPSLFGRLVNVITDPNKNPGLSAIDHVIADGKSILDKVGKIPVVGSLDESLVKNTFKDAWSVYQQFPSKIMQDFYGTYNDFKNVGDTSGVYITPEGTHPKSVIGNTEDALLKGIFRPAGDIGAAIFAPLGAALGSILKGIGVQHLEDSTGQVIADHSGITDLPAFQNFAAAHPNFSEDFNRVLNTVMAAGETEPIRPKQMLSDIFGLAKKTIDQALPPTGTPSTPEELAIHQKTENEALASQEPVKRGTQPNPMNAEPGNYDTKEGNVYTPDSQLPTIDLGKAPKDTSGLPTIDFGSNDTSKTTKAPPGYKYLPLNEDGSAPGTAPKQFIPSPDIGFESAPKISTPRVDYTQTANADGQPVSKLVSDIANDLKMDTENLPGYTGMNMVEQSQRAVQFITDSPKEALDVAMGRAPAPDGIREGAIFKAVKRIAQEQGDVETLQQLTKTKLAGEAGQRLKAYDDGSTPNNVDVVKEMTDIKKIREETQAKRLGKSSSESKSQVVSEALDAVIKKGVPSKASFTEFIKSLDC